MGIWHETYRVADGRHETIYHHMPPFGLGGVGELTEIGVELGHSVAQSGTPPFRL